MEKKKEITERKTTGRLWKRKAKSKGERVRMVKKRKVTNTT